MKNGPPVSPQCDVRTGEPVLMVKGAGGTKISDKKKTQIITDLTVR